MRALYKIDDDILSCIDMETGEIVDADKLDSLQMERKQKLEGVALWQKETALQVKSLKTIINEYKEKLKSAERREAALKEYLMNALNGQKMRTENVNIYYKSSSSVNVSCDVSNLPQKFVRTKTEITADKELLKKALNEGETIEGVFLVPSKSIIIR